MNRHEIEWSNPTSFNPAITAYLRANFIEDSTQRETFDHGFEALRRHELVLICKRHGIPIEREDLPKERLVQRVQVAWEQGQMGKPEDWLNKGAQDYDALAKRVDKLEAGIEKILAAVTSDKPEEPGEPVKPEEPAKPGEPDYGSMSIQDLRKLASLRDLKPDIRWNKQEVIDRLREQDATTGDSPFGNNSAPGDQRAS